MILHQFWKKQSILQSPNPDDTVIPIIAIEIAGKATLSRFFSLILNAMMQPHGERTALDALEPLTRRILERYQVRIILIDEFSNLAGGLKNSEEILKTMRNLNNTLGISFICAGTNAAGHVLSTDLQMARRFQTIILPFWEFGDDYRDLLASFEQVLPLALPSHLKSDENLSLAKKIYAMGGESIAGTAHVLKLAAREAILSGSECITLKTLSVINWSAPESMGLSDEKY